MGEGCGEESGVIPGYYNYCATCGHAHGAHFLEDEHQFIMRDGKSRRTSVYPTWEQWEVMEKRVKALEGWIEVLLGYRIT